MKCYSCKKEHDTANEVRACHAKKVRLSHGHGLPAPATPRQVSLAHALGRERERLVEYKDRDKADYEAAISLMTFTEISVFIDMMLKQPYVRGAQSGYAGWDDRFESIKPGKYALESEDGSVRFYQVHRLMRDGRGNKRMDVSELTGAPGEFRRRKLMRVYKILDAIHADPMAAFALFGLKVGRCGVCSSPLTQEHTRKRGIGDICYEKLTGGS